MHQNWLCIGTHSAGTVWETLGNYSKFIQQIKKNKKEIKRNKARPNSGAALQLDPIWIQTLLALQLDAAAQLVLALQLVLVLQLRAATAGLVLHLLQKCLLQLVLLQLVLALQLVLVLQLRAAAAGLVLRLLQKCLLQLVLLQLVLVLLQLVLLALGTPWLLPLQRG